MDDYESLSPAKWGANIPRGVHSPVPQEVVYGELGQYVWRCSQVGAAEGKPDRTRSPHAGSRQRPQQPLRAAPSLKPPALPGDTYFGEHSLRKNATSLSGQVWWMVGFPVVPRRPAEVLRKRYIRRSSL